jgi:hypothetical protein
MRRAGVKTLVTSVLLAGSLVVLSAQDVLPPPFPRTNAVLLLENDVIRVWNVVWPKGQPTALHRHVYDQVGTYYEPGGRVIRNPDGSARTTDTPVGALSTTRKGTTHIEEGTTDPPLRAIFIELKRETPSGRTPGDTSPSHSFPRVGAKQLLDDERVTVWDVAAWTTGPDGLKYTATRESVIVWLGSGSLRVTRRGGAADTVSVGPGTMRHLESGSAEVLEMAGGSPRAMVFEFK